MSNQLPFRFDPITITITIPDSLESRMDSRSRMEYKGFLQGMANRLAVGSLRYKRRDRPEHRNQYLTCLKKELKAYSKTGNMEHLINIANYAFLESSAPQHPNFHFNNLVDSVTR